MNDSKFKGYGETEKTYVHEVFKTFTNASSGQINTEHEIRPDDYLDFHELMCAMRALGFNPTKKEVLQILERSDPTKKRRITFVQFEKEMSNLFRKRDPQTEIEKAFKLFSSDGLLNGEGITFESLRDVALSLGEDIDDQELRSMINEFDLSGDGKIDLDEFMRICERR